MISKQNKTSFSEEPEPNKISDKYVPFMNDPSPTNLKDGLNEKDCTNEDEDNYYRSIFERKTGFQNFYSKTFHNLDSYGFEMKGIQTMVSKFVSNGVPENLKLNMEKKEEIKIEYALLDYFYQQKHQKFELIYSSESHMKKDSANAETKVYMFKLQKNQSFLLE